MKKAFSLLPALLIAGIMMVVLPACPEVKIEGDTVSLTDIAEQCEGLLVNVVVTQTGGGLTTQESFGAPVKAGKMEHQGFNKSGALRLDMPITITVTLLGVVPRNCPLSKDKTYTFSGTLTKTGEKSYAVSLAKFTAS
jgi:hypothetical protein